MSLNADPLNDFVHIIQAMHGLVPGVQYATLGTVIVLAGITAFTYCYTHKRK